MSVSVFYCIGNHDLVKGKYGEELFESIYGPVYYSSLVKATVPTVDDVPIFDFVLLGVGEDGHSFPAIAIVYAHLQYYMDIFSRWLCYISLQTHHINCRYELKINPYYC